MPLQERYPMQPDYFNSDDIEDVEMSMGGVQMQVVKPKPKRGSDSRLMKIAQKYEQMISNGRILSNRAAMEVLDGRVKQLAERIDVEDAPDRMARLHNLWEEFKTAYNADKASEMIVAIKKLDNEFEKAYHDYKAWEQLMQLFDLRRKLVDSEVKTIKEIKAILTAEDAHNLVAKLLAVVIRVVQDTVKLRIIHFEFARIIGEHNLDANASMQSANDDPGSTMDDEDE
jgi:hypothetical protein